ncbi:MAG TPA: hypothetical protein VGA73_13305 [Candidatus Binatia bacterium]
MKGLLTIAGLIAVYTIFTLSSCATQQEAKAPAKPAAQAEAKPAPAPAPTKAETKAPAKAETKTETKAEAKANGGEKAKAEKAKGDVGLLDTDKNYLILVTKEGKLITLDFDQKTKATMLEEKPAKMSDVGLGSSADVEYVTQGDKKVVTKMEFKPAKGE